MIDYELQRHVDHHNSKITASTTYHYCFLLVSHLFTMSTLLRLGPAPPKTSQFIRPTSPFDVVSVARRLALSGECFTAALAYAKAMSRGQAGKFPDALMAALGNTSVMSMENTYALF